MHHPEIEPTHLHRVVIATWIGMATGLLVLIVLAGIAMTATSYEPGTELLAGVYDNLVIGSMLVLIVVSVLVQAWARLALGQRRLMAELRIVRLQVLSVEQRMMPRQPVITTAFVGRSAPDARHEVDTEPIADEPKPTAASVPPDDIDGLTPEMVELARRTSERLRGANGSK